MERTSPLFTPVLWEEDHFKILDETLLPSRMEYITVNEVGEAIQAVKGMKTRAFGQALTFLYAAALAVRSINQKGPEPVRERIAQLTEEFSRARPTFDFNGLAEKLLELSQEYPVGEEVGSWIEGKIHEFIATIQDARDRRAEQAAELLPNPCRLLTHCNISGELVAVAQYSRAMGKDLNVIATETRPYLQGSRLTAWEVDRAGIDVALIPDCAIAQVMAKGEVNAVLVGSDRCALNGDIINKVGTYPLALVAREYGIPFYVLVQDPSISTGDDVPIEERPVAELLTFQGCSLTPQGTQGLYPAFDVTPASLISYLIGFDGAFVPESFRKRFQKESLSVEKRKREKKRLILLYGIPRRNSYDYLSHALKAERAQSVLLPEMRPELWGAHVVTRELVERGLPTTFISDNMMGTFFAHEEVRRLYLFYEELGEEGPVGICGSLLAVLLARAHGVPVELLESEQLKHPPLDHGVSTFLGQRVSPEGVAAVPIDRELIPWSLFKEK